MTKCYLLTDSDMLQYHNVCLLARSRTAVKDRTSHFSCRQEVPQTAAAVAPRRHNTNTVYRSASPWNDQNWRTNLSLSGPWKNERVSRGESPLILDFSTKWRWVANFTSLLPNHFTPRPQNTVAPARNQTLNYPAYSSVTIPLAVSQFLNVLCQFILKTKQLWHSNLQMFHTAQVTDLLHLKIMQNFLDLLQHLQNPLTCAAVISWHYMCNWVLTAISKPDLYEATCTT